jgi:hypothetical protein
MALKDCCAKEAATNLTKHLDIATCEGCGRLLLAYGDENTFRLTVEELESKDVGFDADDAGPLWIVAKER